MKTLIKILSVAVLSLGLFACTQKQGVRNKALVQAVEKFDQEVQATAKANFVDKEQQQVFADFTKVNTKIDVTSFEMKGDNEGTGELVIRTFPKSLVEEFKTISGKDWKAKADAAMETKKYTIKMQKKDDVWTLVEQTEKSP